MERPRPSLLPLEEVEQPCTVKLTQRLLKEYFFGCAPSLMSESDAKGGGEKRLWREIRSGGEGNKGGSVQERSCTRRESTTLEALGAAPLPLLDAPSGGITLSCV